MTSSACPGIVTRSRSTPPHRMSRATIRVGGRRSTCVPATRSMAWGNAWLQSSHLLQDRNHARHVVGLSQDKVPGNFRYVMVAGCKYDSQVAAQHTCLLSEFFAGHA